MVEEIVQISFLSIQPKRVSTDSRALIIPAPAINGISGVNTPASVSRMMLTLLFFSRPGRQAV